MSGAWIVDRDMRAGFLEVGAPVDAFTDHGDGTYRLDVDVLLKHGWTVTDEGGLSAPGDAPEVQSFLARLEDRATGE